MSTPTIEPASVLFAEIFGPLKYGEGSRIGVIGDSGCGKTVAVRRVLAEWVTTQTSGLAYVHDDTGPPQFAGQLRAFPSSLTTEPLDPKGPRVVVFRGSDTGQAVDPESLARAAWVLARGGTPMLLLLDELERSAANGRWKHDGCPAGRAKNPGPCLCTLPKVFSWGRRSRISALWTTQSPQSAPREAFEQSSVLLCFHLAGRGLRYLRALDYADGAEHILPQLPDSLLPPNQRGTFVLLRRGARWNGKFYRL